MTTFNTSLQGGNRTTALEEKVQKDVPTHHHFPSQKYSIGGTKLHVLDLSRMILFPSSSPFHQRKNTAYHTCFKDNSFSLATYNFCLLLTALCVCPVSFSMFWLAASATQGGMDFCMLDADGMGARPNS